MELVWLAVVVVGLLGVAALTTLLLVEAVDASRVGLVPQQENEEGVRLRLTADADATNSVRFCRAGRGIVK